MCRVARVYSQRVAALRGVGAEMWRVLTIGGAPRSDEQASAESEA